MSKQPDWANDPLLRDAQARSRAHGALTRSALIWTPPFVIVFGLLLFFIWDRIVGPDYGATWFLVGVLTIFSLLIGFMSLSAIRDLIGGTKEMEGVITRKWSRRDSLVWQSHYLRINEKIVRVDPVTHSKMEKGDTILIEFYPNSGITVTAALVNEDADGAEGGDRAARAT